MIGSPRHIKRVDSLNRYQPRMRPTATPSRGPARSVPTYTAPPAPRFHPVHMVAYTLATLVAVGVISLVPKGLAAVHNVRLSTIVQNLTTRVIASTTPKINTTKLQADLNAQIAAHPNLTIGVSMEDLSTGTRVSAGSSAPFVGASTTKVLTAAAFMKSVENGHDSLGETLGGYPAQWQLKQMLNRSDNDSWARLYNQVGLPQLQAYAHSIGMASYSVNTNSLTAADDATLLAQLYGGKLLSEGDTQLVLSYMQNTNNEDMIPAAVPDGAVVYHKYGQLDGYLHDTGIIRYNGRTYALSVYTSGVDGSDYTSRVQTIRSLVRTVVGDMPSGRI